MKLRREMMLLSVISIIFLAGCVRGGGEGPTAAGVIIKSFAPDVQSVDGGSDVVFSTDIQNIGVKKANNVKVLFFGLSNEWKTKDTTPQSFTFKLDTSVTSLAGADPQAGLKGEETIIELTLKAPPGKGTDVTYDTSVRVFYDYATVSDTLLRFVSSQYAKTAPNAQRGVVSSASTSGPLLVTTTARTSTITSGTNFGRIQFEIQNIGGGRVFTGGLDTNNNPVSLDSLTKIEVTGAKTCSGVSFDSDNVIRLTPEKTSLRLAGGKSKIVSCDVDLSNLVNFKDVGLNVTISYSYFVDSATTVTVLRGFE